MRIILTAIISLFVLSSLQAQNPYKSIGKEAEVLTLSNGKYQEFIPNDTLVVIGSVIYNTVTDEVVAFAVPDTVLTELGFEPEVRSRFLSIDPHASRYPSISPYSYVANNPLKWIDPDGKDIVNPLKYILSNKQVVNSLKMFNTYVSILSGQKSESFTFQITGGDRYKGSDGRVYSATTNEAETGIQNTLSRHLQERGALAADIGLIAGEVDNEILIKAAEMAGFFDDGQGIRMEYRDGHIHFALSLSEQGNYLNEGNVDKNFVPTFKDLNHDNSTMLNFAKQLLESGKINEEKVNQIKSLYEDN